MCSRGAFTVKILATWSYVVLRPVPYRDKKAFACQELSIRKRHCSRLDVRTKAKHKAVWQYSLYAFFNGRIQSKRNAMTINKAHSFTMSDFISNPFYASQHDAHYFFPFECFFSQQFKILNAFHICALSYLLQYR